MENVASSNAALMRRIVQLEKERDELQRDIETMCLQQSGVAGGVDVNSRMQARRAAALEQELESTKEKTTLLTRENHNLQEELTEAYRLKSRLTEAFKAAVEKNNQVEKEVKFYQSKVAAALSERDKAVVEVERVHGSEKTMIEKEQELRDRVEEAEGLCKEHEAHELELQQDLDNANSQLDLLCKVVYQFWELRESALGSPNEDDQPQVLPPIDKATALLTESDARWAYGGPNKQAEEALRQEVTDAQALAEENHQLAMKEQLRVDDLEAQLAGIKEEFEVTIRTLQSQLEEEQHGREQAAEKASIYKVNLEKLEKITISKLPHLLQVQNDHEDLRTKVDSLLEDEKQWIATMVADFEAILVEIRLREVHSELVDKYEEERGPPLEEDILAATNVSLSPEAEEMSTSESLIEPSQGVSISEQVEMEGACPIPEISIVVSTLAVEPEIMAEAHPVGDEGNDEPSIIEEHLSTVVNMSTSATDMDDESRKALAQALHEKVEALLLLSQQEERYYMETKTIQGLESQIKDLNAKISQVTCEKVSALMEVAQLRQDCQRLEEREKELIRRLQQHRSTNASGRLMPASWSESSAPQVTQEPTPVQANRKPIVPKPSLLTTGGYLKSWLRGMDVSGPGGLKAASDSSKPTVGTDASKNNELDDSVDFARLRVENAALQERVASVQRLTESAHRLRMMLVNASTTSQSKEVAQSLLDIIDGVSAEAASLRIALSCSLPVSLPPESTLPASDMGGLTLSEDTVAPSDDNGEAQHATVDIATAAGMEMVELLLIAAELQRARVQCEIDQHPSEQG